MAYSGYIFPDDETNDTRVKATCPECKYKGTVDTLLSKYNLVIRACGSIAEFVEQNGSLLIQ